VKSSKPVFVASDVHLGTISSTQERAFLGWLEYAAGAASEIVLNGDLFDFWYEYVWGTSRGHDRTLGLLKRVVDSGVPITLMGGNHDWWGGSYLREEIGLDFLRDPVVRGLAGHRTLIAHGDGLGEGDLGYRVLRLILRGRLTRAAFALLPPVVGDRVARGVSKTEERWSAPGPLEEARSDTLERWAVAELGRRPELDLITLGHTHLPRAVRLDDGRWYINTGDWVYHRSYLTLEEGRDPELLEWEGAPRVRPTT
jgi:UDP-2,3-diacylglucosamine hydrolase